MKNVTYVINQEILLIENEMIEKKKHLISTATLRKRARAHLDLSVKTKDAKYCADFGFNQLICQRLYAKGYRSVREGYYVNLDRCYDVDYLIKLTKSADCSAKEKTLVAKRIKTIRNTRCDGQLEWNLKTGEIIETMNEAEFMKKIEEDAV